MDARDRFWQLLRQDSFPCLRSDGFKGNGKTFRRFAGAAVHVVNIQGERRGGECCVNLGLHYLFFAKGRLQSGSDG